VKAVPFAKMSGLGNDFIVVDNRSGVLDGMGLDAFARKVCTPRLSLGGDELMVIEAPAAGGDYSMRTINPDGSEVKMCGNASRCVARYAYVHDIAGQRQHIDTLGGPVEALIDGDQVRVGLSVTSVPELDFDLEAEGRLFRMSSLEISGAPHAVVRFDGIESAPAELVHRLGKAIRRHARFQAGTNVNFVEPLGRQLLRQRTFERGVEGETLACGTGATASSLICALGGLVDSPVTVRVQGGDLTVSFERTGNVFSRIFLGGGARFVAEGTIHPEGWQW
jgi:diaminopimelate epimerase